MNVLLRSVSALALASAALAAPAQNLVSNPGFESGGLNGYAGSFTDAGPSSSIFLSSTSHTGSYAAGLSVTGTGTATLYQDLPTVPGALYLVSFFSAAQPFAATFGSAGTMTSGTASYAPYSFLAYATGSVTRLSFSVTGTRNGVLDDLSVTAAPVPEPSALAALGLGAVAFVKRRKRA